MATIAIVSHGRPREPQPHVALFHHAEIASSEANTTTVAMASRARESDSVVVEVGRKFALRDERAGPPEDRAARPGIQFAVDRDVKGLLGAAGDNASQLRVTAALGYDVEPEAAQYTYHVRS